MCVNKKPKFILLLTEFLSIKFCSSFDAKTIFHYIKMSHFIFLKSKIGFSKELKILLGELSIFFIAHAIE